MGFPLSFSRAREGSTPPTARFRTDGVPIDAAGIGTKMGVSADAPTLDSAYKLVAFGNRQVLKLSAGKATLPGAKQVWRSLPMGEDLLAVRNEPGPAGSRSSSRSCARVDASNPQAPLRLRKHGWHAISRGCPRPPESCTSRRHWPLWCPIACDRSSPR